MRASWSALVGAALVPVVWFLVGPWDLSTVSPDGQPGDESTGMVRVLAVLVVLDLLAAAARWRGLLTFVAATVGGGVVWTMLAFAITATSRVSGANMAALWFVLGPAIIAANTAGVVILDHLVFAHPSRRSESNRRAN